MMEAPNKKSLAIRFRRPFLNPFYGTAYGHDGLNGWMKRNEIGFKVRETKRLKGVKGE